MTTITARSAAKVSKPRAGEVASNPLARLMNWFENLARAPEDVAPSGDLAKEAEALRRYAQRFADHDPRFADDLLAAADRHERGE